jgi:hypothetical protein
MVNIKTECYIAYFYNFIISTNKIYLLWCLELEN